MTVAGRRRRLRVHGPDLVRGRGEPRDRHVAQSPSAGGQPRVRRWRPTTASRSSRTSSALLARDDVDVVVLASPPAGHLAQTLAGGGGRQAPPRREADGPVGRRVRRDGGRLPRRPASACRSCRSTGSATRPAAAQAADRRRRDRRCPDDPADRRRGRLVGPGGARRRVEARPAPADGLGVVGRPRLRPAALVQRRRRASSPSPGSRTSRASRPASARARRCTYEMTSGALAQILMSYEFPPPGIQPSWPWRIVGSTGIIELDPYRDRPARAGRRLGDRGAEQAPFDPMDASDPVRLRAYAAPARGPRGGDRRRPRSARVRARRATTPRRCSRPPNGRPRAVRPRSWRDAPSDGQSIWTDHPGGPLRYRADGRFGADGLPPGAWFGRVSAVVEAPDGTVVVFHRGPPIEPVVFLDREGRYLRSWDADFGLPHGMRLMPGRSSLADRRRPASRRQGDAWPAKFSLISARSTKPARTSGRSTGRPTLRSRPTARSTSPTAMATAGSFGSTRTAPTWGRGAGPGTAPGEFDTPHSVAVAPDGPIWVSDREQPADPAVRARTAATSTSGRTLARPSASSSTGTSCGSSPTGRFGELLGWDSLGGRLMRIDPSDGSVLGSHSACRPLLPPRSVRRHLGRRDSTAPSFV